MNSPRKHRRVLKAVFIGIEDERGGVGDLFIKYLKWRFAKNSKVSIQHHPCKGGSYADMLRTAKRRMGNDDYDSRLMVWDADRAETGEDAMPENDENFDELVPLRPCIEGVLLQLLAKPVPADSQKCKSVLRAEGTFDHVERFIQKFGKIPDAHFLQDSALAKILSAMQPTP